MGFPRGSVVKNPPANAGDRGLIPWYGRSPGVGNGNPLQYSCLQTPMDRGAWRAAVHGVAKDSDDWGIDFHSPHPHPRKIIQGKNRQQWIPHKYGLTGPGNYVAWHILCSSLQETQASSPKGHLWCIFKSMGGKKRLSFTIDLAKVPLSKEAQILKTFLFFFFFLHVRWGREAWASVKTYYKQLKTWKNTLAKMPIIDLHKSHSLNRQQIQTPV